MEVHAVNVHKTFPTHAESIKNVSYGRLNIIKTSWSIKLGEVVMVVNCCKFYHLINRE